MENTTVNIGSRKLRTPNESEKEYPSLFPSLTITNWITPIAWIISTVHTITVNAILIYLQKK
tara:strand:- start:6 stop:191 length:186 start_codon:yes stop_codon:yes gene_type:complete